MTTRPRHPSTTTDSSRVSVAATVSDLATAAGRQVRHTAVWVHVDDPAQDLPGHGWKLHLSARFSGLPGLVAVVVPFLLEQRCAFKVARSVRVLSELNDGVTAPSGVGKAITVYPDQKRVVDLGKQLAELLRGRAGPQVLSDRQVSPDAPVYYRYGPFRSSLAAGRDGNLRSVMHGPDGQTFDGTALLSFRQPPWTTDPFLGTPPASPAGNEEALLGNHYRLFKGLMESVRGNVYAATDVRTGETVVVKQARAWVAESPDGDDARIRLRNERFALTALADVPAVARFRDHFRHGLDEYLVTSFDGKFSLTEHVARKGRFLPLPRNDFHRPPGLAEGRSLDALAHELARTVRAVHRRGFLLRDLSPKNVVVAMTGDAVTLIDFGHCHHDGVSIRGGTKGYAPARQIAGEPAGPGDDLHALGMTLFAAATGAEPLVAEDDPDASRVMALGVLDRMHGDRMPAVVGLVTDLLSGEPATMAAAFTVLADGGPVPGRPRVRRHAPVPHRRADGTGLLDRVLQSLVSCADLVLDRKDEILDASVYRGTAGIGLCLLPHLDRPGVAGTVDRLAEATVRTAERLSLQPALYLGTTGAEIFLRRAHAAGVGAGTLGTTRLFGEPGHRFEGDDLMIGAAGIGLGHLLLGELDSLDSLPEHDAAARRCLEQIAAHDDPVSWFPAEEVAIPGLDTTLGVAHGHAGSVEFLRRMALRDPGGQVAALFAARAARLAERVSEIVETAGRPDAVPLSASWCRGMAGLGRVMCAAGRHLGDDSLVKLAVDCADGCLRWLPSLATAGQCCGVAGIGELFCDLAGQDERFVAAAESAVTQLLVLRADAPPTPPERSWGRPSGLSWAAGAAGVLAFLTRLRDLPAATGIAGPF